MQTQRRASHLQDLPHFLQKLHVAYDTSVIHVPLVVHRVQSCDLVDKGVDAATEIQWAKRVALLHSCARLDDVLVIVKQHRRLSVTPLSPVRHGWKHAVDCLHEVAALHLVEGVAKVDLEETELGLLVLLQSVAK